MKGGLTPPVVAAATHLWAAGVDRGMQQAHYGGAIPPETSRDIMALSWLGCAERICHRTAMAMSFIAVPVPLVCHDAAIRLPPNATKALWK